MKRTIKMKYTLRYTTLLIGAALLLSSCVSKKKYEEAQARIDHYQTEQQTCEQSVAALRVDTSRLSEALAGTQSRLDMTYARLKKLEETRGELPSAEKRLRKQLNEVQAMLEERRSTLRDLEAEITDALVEYPQDEMDVKLEGGEVHIRLANSLLFLSGSTDINERGEAALTTLAKVLRDNPDMQLRVEGHTDAVPVKPSARFDDNWDLSVLRATEVVRALQEHGVRPEQLMPAGRSKYEPLADNETASGRQANRRTEIIVAPDLGDLYEQFMPGGSAYGSR